MSDCPKCSRPIKQMVKQDKLKAFGIETEFSTASMCLLEGEDNQSSEYVIHSTDHPGQ